MRAVLVLLTIANVALGVLLVALSGFVLEGVNNTGPMMPEAVVYIGLMGACLVAPAAAWFLHKRITPVATLLIAAAPLAVAALLLLIKPAAGN